jgi:hypothetical protein
VFEHITASDWIEIITAAVVVLGWLFRLESAVKDAKAAIGPAKAELEGQMRTERVRIDGKFETMDNDMNLQVGFMRETMGRIEKKLISIDAKIDRRNEARDLSNRENWPGSAE